MGPARFAKLTELPKTVHFDISNLECLHLMNGCSDLHEINFLTISMKLCIRSSRLAQFDFLLFSESLGRFDYVIFRHHAVESL